MSVAALAIDRLFQDAPLDDSVIVVVGPSGSGKTHFVLNTLLETPTDKTFYIEPYDACPAQPPVSTSQGKFQQLRFPIIPAHLWISPILAIDEVLVWDRQSLINTVNERIGKPGLLTVLIVQTLDCLEGIYDTARNPRVVKLHNREARPS